MSPLSVTCRKVPGVKIPFRPLVLTVKWRVLGTINVIIRLLLSTVSFPRKPCCEIGPRSSTATVTIFSDAVLIDAGCVPDCGVNFRAGVVVVDTVG